MSETYFKAVRPNGTSFHDPAFRWLPEDGIIPDDGHLVTLGGGVMDPDDAATYLSVSVEPADCTRFQWPCRLLRVEPAGNVIAPDLHWLPSKRSARSWRVIEELDPHMALGPNGVEVAALLDEIGAFSAVALDAALDASLSTAQAAARDAELDTSDAAWGTVRDAAWVAARVAARSVVSDAARDATWVAARAAARQPVQQPTRDVALAAVAAAAGATVVRDLISAEHYDTLMAPIEAARAVMQEEAAR